MYVEQLGRFKIVFKYGGKVAGKRESDAYHLRMRRERSRGWPCWAVAGRDRLRSPSSLPTAKHSSTKKKNGPLQRWRKQSNAAMTLLSPLH